MSRLTSNLEEKRRSIKACIFLEEDWKSEQKLETRAVNNSACRHFIASPSRTSNSFQNMEFCALGNLFRSSRVAVIILSDWQNIPSLYVFPEPNVAPNTVGNKNTQIEKVFISCNKLLLSVNATRINKFFATKNQGKKQVWRHKGNLSVKRALQGGGEKSSILLYPFIPTNIAFHRVIFLAMSLTHSWTGKDVWGKRCDVQRAWEYRPGSVVSWFSFRSIIVVVL